jgi:hypothetical protein
VSINIKLIKLKYRNNYFIPTDIVIHDYSTLNKYIKPRESEVEFIQNEVNYYPEWNGIMGRFSDVKRDMNGKPLLFPVCEEVLYKIPLNEVKIMEVNKC